MNRDEIGWRSSVDPLIAGETLVPPSVLSLESPVGLHLFVDAVFWKPVSFNYIARHAIITLRPVVYS